MKSLHHNPYYPELWDRTDIAPAWDADRVWYRIQGEQATQKYRWSWWIWLAVLLLFTGVRSLSSGEAKQTLPGNGSSVDPPELIISPVPIVQNPEPLPLKSVTFAPRQNEQKDVAQASKEIFNKPAARFEKAPVASLPSPSLQLITERIRPIHRPGTKLTMKLPILPELPSVQAPYLVRVIDQIRQWNTKGTVDWEQLNIIPDDHGGFIIRQYPSNQSTKTN